MDKNGAVVILFRSLDVGLGHVHQVEAALGGAHLVPLGVVPVKRMDAADGLHGQEHHQFKMRDMSLDGLAAQGFDKILSRRHSCHAPISSNFNQYGKTDFEMLKIFV